MWLACIKTGSDVWGRPAGMSADEHRRLFEKEMREAFSYLIIRRSCCQFKIFQVQRLYNRNNTYLETSMEPITHIQDLVQYDKPGYRNVTWRLKPDVIYVYIDDIFWPKQKGARDYCYRLKLTIGFSDEEGARTICKEVSRTPCTCGGEYVVIEDKTFTYQGHKVDTGAEVVELVKNLGDMPCIQALN
jgi:hypothetical protein